MSDLRSFFGANAGYVLELYDRYLKDPSSVDAATRDAFARWTPDDLERASTSPAGAAPSGLSVADVTRITRLSHYARTIRTRGHLAARLDPLGTPPKGDPGLELAGSGVTQADLEQLPASVIKGPASLTARSAGEVIEALRAVYCGTTGYDYAHIQDPVERDWIRDAVESGRFRQPLDTAAKRLLLERLTDVEAFEALLHRALPGQKRFSIEGTDILVPMLDAIIASVAAAGTHEVVMGMAHRGRLNVLAHVLGKPYAQIFSEFQRATSGPTTAPSEHFAHYGWTGDVKYHLGAKKTFAEGEAVQARITLAPNPSHLEFVNPVIQGMTRALQDDRSAPCFPVQNVEAALAILIHGDAAFPGEGVVAETLNLSQLLGYRTGGTVNIIANNQLGFTTDPIDARSTLYASDLAKGYEIPIVHVNADDPEACLAAARLAIAYRERFHKDFLIDLVGYRRWGHNEGDEPAYTQPLIYEKMRAHPTVRALWARRLDSDDIMPVAESDELLRASIARLQDVLSRGLTPNTDQAASTNGSPMVTVPGVSADQLRVYNDELLRQPEGFTVHPKIDRLLQARKDAIGEKGGIDWAHAESLAFATLLAQGTPIRLSGQDSERGTFSQRHLVLHDVNTGKRYIPVHALKEAKASFAVYNSPLSEVAVLGFEYGYSGVAANTCLLWEAQFGDFANAGQVIIDQFLSAARAKWREKPWLVLLLPHGYEGQGPEHSSGRLERFLQLAGGDNLRVANCSTAAQYFHLLRLQVAMHDEDARPLVIMTPKSLLRHPLASSRLDDLADGRFMPVIDDPERSDSSGAVTRLILCTGKVYVDLVSHPERAEAQRVAIVRVELLYPFPDTELQGVLGRYPNLREIIWLQEEPKNMGAWSYMAPRLRDLIGRDPKIDYIGRPDRASPAEGSAYLHQAEQARITAEAFSGLQGPPPTQSHGVKQHAR